MRQLATIYLCAALCLFALTTASEAFFHGKKETAPVTPDYFKQLGIEKPGKKIVAPDFSLEDLSGKRVTLKSLKGKVVFLNFWATWCIPCRQEMPAMEKLYRELNAEGLEVVAVNFRETKKEVRKFFDELGLTFTALLDKEGKVSEEYGAWSLPLSYFISRRGEFVGKTIGSREWDSQEGRAFFSGLLVEKPQ